MEQILGAFRIETEALLQFADVIVKMLAAFVVSMGDAISCIFFS